MPSRSYSTEAIVLRQRRLGDADRILTVFTPELGRLDMVAKGVRRPKSRMAGHVEVLSHASLLVHRGRSLDVVSQAQLVENFRSLRENLSLLSRALYAAELVERFTDSGGDCHPVFQLLVGALRRLEGNGASPDLVLRCFELDLLSELGYQPQVDACVGCGSALPPETNYYSAQAGGVVCAACRDGVKLTGPLSLNGLKVMRLMQRAPFEEIARVAIGPQLAGEIEHCLRDQIAFSLEREVRSMSFLKAVQRQEQVALRA